MNAIRIAVVVALALLALSPADAEVLWDAADPTTAVKEFRRQRAEARLAEQEAACLRQLQSAETAEQTGKAYAGLAKVSLQKGVESLAEAIDYCRRALACPQDLQTRIDLHMDWGYAILHMPAGTPKAKALQREQGVAQYLQALKLAVDNQTAAHIRPLPKAVAGQADTSEREDVRLQNDLIAVRKAAAQLCAEQYLAVPDGRKELERLATTALNDAALVQEILAVFDRFVQLRAGN